VKIFIQLHALQLKYSQIQLKETLAEDSSVLSNIPLNSLSPPPELDNEALLTLMLSWVGIQNFRNIAESRSKFKFMDIIQSFFEI
jgi:hypothetical protein